MPYEIHGFRIKTALNEYQDSLLDQKSATIPSLTHNQIQCLQELVSNMPESLHNSQDLQYTLAEGVPLPRKDTTTQITTGSDGGFVLWTSSQLIEILAHFSRERIPERTIQAKVSAVWGYCEVTDDVSDLNDSSLAHKTAPTTLDVVSSSSPVPIPVSRSAKDSGFEQATELWVKAMDKQDGAQARFIENVSTHAAGVKSTWLREKIYDMFGEVNTELGDKIRSKTETKIEGGHFLPHKTARHRKTSEIILTSSLEVDSNC